MCNFTLSDRLKFKAYFSNSEVFLSYNQGLILFVSMTQDFSLMSMAKYFRYEKILDQVVGCAMGKYNSK